MGNKKSTMQNQPNKSTSDAVIEQNVGDNIYDRGQQIYQRMRNPEPHVDILVDKARGINLSYVRDKPYNPIISSENPRYIEFVVCKGNMEEDLERFAVHSDKPNHNCRGNCPCIVETVKVEGSRGIGPPSSDFKLRSFVQTYSPTSSEHVDRNNGPPFSPTSDDNDRPISRRKGSSRGAEDTSSDIPYGMNNGQTFSPTSDDEPISRRRVRRGREDTSSDLPHETNYDDLSPTSSESILKSKDAVFSPTSRGGTCLVGGKKKKTDDDSDGPLDDEDDDDDDDDDVDDDEDENDVDDDDDDEVDDEDLDELDKEDGVILEKSDIDTEDIYRIQSRFFESSDEKLTDIEGEGFEDDELTEQVRNAMEARGSTSRKIASGNTRADSRTRMFDTEEADILGMDDSENYMKRPIKKNDKYA